MPNSPTIFIFLIFLCVIFVIYSLYTTFKLHILAKNLRNAQEYNHTLLELYDDVRSFKHDFQNIVFTIGGFINTNDIENLKKYYNSLFEECKKINNFSALNPDVINNAGIYHLLTCKYQKAEEKNVKMNIECFIDFNKLHISIYELSRLLGIFIDNAIEAASTANEKIVNIVFRDSLAHCTQFFIIENTYNNHDIDISKIFEKGVTTKENHSGIGLWKVNKIVKNNKNLNLVTINGEKFFKQQLEVYY